MANPVKKKKTVKFSQLAAIILSKEYIMTEKIKKKKKHVRVFEAGKSRAKIQEGTTAHTRSPEKGGLTTHRTVPTR